MEKLNFRIGMTAVEVVTAVVRINPQIKSLNFYIYNPRLNTKESGVEDLERLIFHDYSEDTREIKRKDITVENLNRFIASLGQASVLSISSEVVMKTPSPLIYHIPMMDFDYPESPENLVKIKDFLHAAHFFEGVILSSGRSYHFYGSRLISRESWYDFLGDCLLSKLVDTRYIGHRLKDGCGILRISACPLRPKVPEVVAIL